jgi:hypothetical protein
MAALASGVFTVKVRFLLGRAPSVMHTPSSSSAGGPVTVTVGFLLTTTGVGSVLLPTQPPLLDVAFSVRVKL